MKRLSTMFLIKIATYLMLLALLTLIVCGFCARDQFYDYFSKFEGVKFCYVYNCDNHDVLSFTKSPETADIVQNGHYLFVRSNEYFFKNAKFKQAYITGDLEKYQDIVASLHLSNVSMEKVGDIIATYGFASGFGEFRWVQNRKVNLQIVFSNGTITFGSPLVYGSY